MRKARTVRRKTARPPSNAPAGPNPSTEMKRSEMGMTERKKTVGKSNRYIRLLWPTSRTVKSTTSGDAA
jgi:hypothetical protein